jgi:hypothetical protein
MLLPDLIDKPLYYGLVALTGRHGAQLGLISHTRTFGHTSLLLLVITAVAVFKKSKAWAALAIGMATHLFLDNLSDTLAVVFKIDMTTRTGGHSALLALLWPYFNHRFGTMPFANLEGHLAHSMNPLAVGGEVLGAVFLGWDYLKKRQGLR